MKLFTLYLITNNLSKTLEKEKMSAIGGKELPGLTVKTLKNMRNDRDFKLFYEKIETSASKIDEASTPMLPRKRKKPNYSILQYVKGNPKPTGEAHHPENAYDHFKQIFFEALDATVNAINDRFDQPAFELFSQVEQLFLKSVKKKDATHELKMVEKHFKDDYDEESLIAELQLLPTIFEEECPPINLEDVVKVIKSFAPEKSKLIQNVVTIIKIILANGATSATPERSFSMLRRIKTWLHSRMLQKRLNSLSIIMYDNKDLLDNLSLIDVANEFAGLQPDRKNAIGSFTVKDL